MPARIAWGERRFDFTFPVDFYPELIERLRGTPARLADRLRSAPADQVNPRAGGKWSMQEHADHLADLDLGLFLPRLDDYEAGVKLVSNVCVSVRPLAGSVSFVRRSPSASGRMSVKAVSNWRSARRRPAASWPSEETECIRPVGIIR